MMKSASMRRRVQNISSRGVKVTIQAGTVEDGWSATNFSADGTSLIITIDIEHITTSNGGGLIKEYGTPWQFYHPSGEMLAHEIGHSSGVAENTNGLSSPVLGQEKQQETMNQTDKEAWQSGADFRREVMDSYTAIHNEATTHKGVGIGRSPTRGDVKLMREQSGQ
jgi:hypothetical protein